jgi:hypothetical protein
VALSPDGTRIAYVSDGRIFVRKLDETDAQELTVAPRTTNFLVWARQAAPPPAGPRCPDAKE